MPNRLIRISTLKSIQLNRIITNPWLFPVVLLVVCFISYGGMVSKLGFYWDDWTIVWYVHFLGPSAFKEAFAGDRPLLAGIYTITTSLLGESALGWQLFAIFTRWLSCLALWWTLRTVWLSKASQIAAITFLFAVYPGFRQQYIAITYGNGFLLQAIFFTSLGLMVWAFRKPKPSWVAYITSIALSAYAMFLVEYFYGLELIIRPLLLWLMLGTTMPPIKKRLKQTLLYWLPYTATNAIFLSWRLTHDTPRGDITIFDRLRGGSFNALVNLISTIFHDIYECLLLAWGQVFHFSSIASSEPAVLRRYILIVLISAIIVFIYLAFLRLGHQTETQIPRAQEQHWALQAMLVGAIALLVGGLPIWMTNLQIALFFPWDRFTITMALGASLFLLGFVEALPGAHRYSAVVIGIAVGLASGFHYQDALAYRKEWLMQRDFFWQLTWRAPGIQPGTVILTSEMPFRYNWDNSLTAPLNWTYAPQIQSLDLPYLLYNVESRLSSGLPDLKADTKFKEYLRITPFHGSTSQAVLVFFRPPGCLKVIDPKLDQYLPDKPVFFREAIPFARTDLILPDASPPARPPIAILGQEPPHSWCFYFEKAELARQQGDWQQVVTLGDQALKDNKEFWRRSVAELMPFIEGYARMHQWDKAIDLSLTAYHSWQNMSLSLCALWKGMEEIALSDHQGQAALQQVYQTFHCSNP